MFHDTPKRPAGHGLQTDAPAVLYWPGEHGTALAFVDPDGQKNPAPHTPEHTDTVKPPDDPNVPASQGPLHAGVSSPVVLPKRPTGQGEHAAAPPLLHSPVPHTDAVEDVDPAAHAYPGLQLPLHEEAVRPDALPNEPGSQGPLQSAVDRPAALP